MKIKIQISSKMKIWTKITLYTGFALINNIKEVLFTDFFATDSIILCNTSEMVKDKSLENFQLCSVYRLHTKGEQTKPEVCNQLVL